MFFLSIDDALAPRDVATTALEAVTFHHNHVEQRRQKKHYTNASRYVTVHLQLGSVQLALVWCLYLSRKQVQRLNRARRETGQPVLRYHRLVEFVEEMLAESAPQLPTACRVYVLFDNWYDGRHLECFIHHHGWHRTVCYIAQLARCGWADVNILAELMPTDDTHAAPSQLFVIDLLREDFAGTPIAGSEQVHAE